MTAEADAPRTAALIPAAGRGQRLGLGPKAFVTVAGRPLLAFALEAFTGLVDEIVVALPPEWLPRGLPGPSSPTTRAVLGGVTRQATVAALARATRAEVVVVHDAARPFVPRVVIERTLEAARIHGAATASLAVADTLVEVADGAPVDRDRLRAVQTPQAFRRDLLLRAHRRAAEEGVRATDDAGLVHRLGHPVVLTEGSPLLFKVTTVDDLRIAAALAVGWGGSSGEPARDR